MKNRGRLAIGIILIVTAISSFGYAFTRESEAWRNSFWFISALLLCLCFDSFLVKRNLIEHPSRLFLIWFPILLLIFMGLGIVLPLREDQFYSGQRYFLWFYSAIVTVTIVMLLVFTGRISAAIIRGRGISPLKALLVVIQAYLALIMSVAIIYAMLENQTWGQAFVGMSPATMDWRSESPSLTELEKASIAEQHHRYYEYFRDPIAVEIDSFYYSVITASTVGYGDIYPATKTARLIVTFHILASQFILIVLIGLVISAFSGGEETPKRST